MPTTASFFVEARPSVSAFDRWARSYAGIAIADHLCFKCASSEEFEALRRMFEGESAFIYQSIISKRRIAIVKFLQPIQTVLGEIWYLELSDQKPDASQTSGFDHIEIYPAEGPVESLVEKLEAAGIKLEKIVRPHHTTFDVDIGEGFKVRLEEGKLVEKIKVEEMG